MYPQWRPVFWDSWCPGIWIHSYNHLLLPLVKPLGVSFFFRQFLASFFSLRFLIPEVVINVESIFLHVMNDFISPLVSIQSFESMAKCFLLIPLMNGKHLSSLVSQICPGFVLGIRPFLWDLLSIPPCPSTHPPHLQFLRCISDLEYLFFPSYLGLPCTYFDFFFFLASGGFPFFWA